MTRLLTSCLTSVKSFLMSFWSQSLVSGQHSTMFIQWIMFLLFPLFGGCTADILCGLTYPKKERIRKKMATSCGVGSSLSRTWAAEIHPHLKTVDASFEGRRSLWIAISAAQARETHDLRHTMSPFFLFLLFWAWKESWDMWVNVAICSAVLWQLKVTISLLSYLRITDLLFSVFKYHLNAGNMVADAQRFGAYILRPWCWTSSWILSEPEALQHLKGLFVTI